MGEKCANFTASVSQYAGLRRERNALSLAVLAFAVEDAMNAREVRMTSASPSAFLVINHDYRFCGRDKVA